MVDKILCPHCNNLNDVHKFCIYCGEKLLDDDQFKLITEDTNPTCLNCGRPVKKNQKKCECGYEFIEINCPDCNSKNEYTNKFCTKCGNKLWRSNISYFKYSQRLFEQHLLNESLPYSLRNTSLYKRPKNNIGKNPVLIQALSGLEIEMLKVNENLIEIGSRWKIISPNYCINCHNIINPSEYSCPKCNNKFADKIKVDFIKNNNYIKPRFEDVDLKWTSKNSENYLSSLSPASGESQFEYRERLKWEFAENNNLKRCIVNAINREELEEKLRRQEEERRRQEEEYIRKYGGGYCNYRCRYYYEEFLDSRGGIVGDFDSEGYVEYRCSLGHSVNHGHYCEDYK